MENFASYTDEELALSYCEGNNRAFDELLSRTQGKLFSYILFIVHNEETANDLFQETFVKIISHLHNGCYANTGRLSAWMMRIAHNVIVDWQRDKKVRNIIDCKDNEELSSNTNANVIDTNVEAQFINAQVMIDIRRIMDQLPPMQREVVYMRFYQDMSFKDIATATGVSINTSLGRMHYAVRNMRRMVKEHSVALELE